MPSSFVIKIAYGGLGDHLFNSHLPRIAKTVGRFDRVYISNLSEYRDLTYRHLIWELNPFVDGFIDEDAPLPDFPYVPEGTNLLDMIMLQRGLDDGARFHDPELYYQAKPRNDVIETCVYDPNYVSYVGDVDVARVSRYLRQEAAPVAQLAARARSFAIPGTPSVQTSSLFDYCDLIHSCKRFVCLASGGATLAAAMKRPATVLFGRGQKRMFHHSKLHAYVEVSPRAWQRGIAQVRAIGANAYRSIGGRVRRSVR